VLFDKFIKQCLKTLRVALERLEHLGGLSADVPPRKMGLQNMRGEGNSVKRAAKVVRHKCQILLTAPLYFELLLSGECLDGQSDRLVQDAIQNMERLALQAEAMVFGEVVYAVATDVVFCYDLYDVKAVLNPLPAVDRRAAFQKRFRDRLVGY